MLRSKRCQHFGLVLEVSLVSLIWLGDSDKLLKSSEMDQTSFFLLREHNLLPTAKAKPSSSSSCAPPVSLRLSSSPFFNFAGSSSLLSFSYSVSIASFFLWLVII